MSLATSAPSLLFSILFTGCVSSSKVVDVRSASGVLQHYPQDVRSVEAWYGHPFKVGGQTVLPTEQVTEAELLKYVGESVKIEGTWEPGVLWKPDDEDLNFSSPVDPNEGPVFRGGGIRVERIEILSPNGNR